MSGTSIGASGGGIKARIRRALSELKHKDGSYGDIFTDGEGNLWVRDKQLQVLLDEIKNNGLILADVIPSLEAIYGSLLGLQELIGARYGEWESVAIAASGTTSTVADLGDSYENLQIIIPTITSAQLYLQVSNSIDGTFQAFGEGTSGYTDTSTGAYSDTWVLGGWRYVKVVSTNAQTNGVSFWLRGVTYK